MTRTITIKDDLNGGYRVELDQKPDGTIYLSMMDTGTRELIATRLTLLQVHRLAKACLDCLNPIFGGRT